MRSREELLQSLSPEMQANYKNSQHELQALSAAMRHVNEPAEPVLAGKERVAENPIHQRRYA